MMASVMVSVEDIPNLTDEQLKEVLESLGVKIGPITPTTRHVHEQMLKRKLGSDEGEDDVCTVVEKAQKVFTEDNVAPAEEPSVYYGLFVPEGTEVVDESQYQKVYTDKSSCLCAVKKLRGSRFKAFRTRAEALHFAEAGPSLVAGGVGQDGSIGAPPANAEKPSPFRGPKSQDLVKFRKAIEKNDYEFFCKCIDENPRYLVSGGDTPAVLQEGFRYNALHVACRTNRPKYLNKVLTVVSQVAFFQKFYPDDSVETSARRSAYLTDLYLNTPDKGLNETPLHFASKHGAVECVRILTSYPACDKLRENKFGQKAIDIVCSRMKGSSDGIGEVITGLLGDQWFVPLLRDDEHCLLPQVGQPWSPQLSSPPCSPPSLTTLSPITNSSASPISPHFKVRGYAGPMSPSQAEVFQRMWRIGTVSASSPHHPRDRLASLRITDQDKGLERMGRELAAEKGVAWMEYWEFLGEFTNLSSEEGLKKLETYLKAKFKRLMKERENLDASELSRRLEEETSVTDCTQETVLPGNGRCDGNVSDVSECSNSTMGELCRELEALRLNTSLSPPRLNSPPHLASASSKFLASLRATEKPEQDEALRRLARSETEEEEVAAGQLVYIIKSTSVTAFRLAELMGELARDLQSTVANLSLPKNIRTKLKPEILCLRNVLGKFCLDEPSVGIEYGFIHILLACKAVQHMQKNLVPCDLSVLVETMKSFVLHHNFIQLDSSDEEGSLETHPMKEKEIDAQHFTCVVRCLVKALTIVHGNSNSEGNLDISGSDSELLLMQQLGECECVWRAGLVNSSKFKSSSENSSKIKGSSDNCSKLKSSSENSMKIKCSSEEDSKLGSNSEDGSELINRVEDGSILKSSAEDDSKIKSSSENSSEPKCSSEDDSKLRSNLEDDLKLRSNSEDGSKLRNSKENSSESKSSSENGSEIKSSLENDSKIKSTTEDSDSDLCNEKKVSGSTVKYPKAFSFLHKMFFSSQQELNEKELSNPTAQSSDNVVRHLLFNEDGDGDGVVMKARLKVTDGIRIAEEALQGSGQGSANQGSEKDVELEAPQSKQDDGEDNDDDSEADSNDDQDSFATAASSVEDDMLTPEQGVTVYIDGDEASKVDMDVLMALGSQEVDVQRYPHTFQWQHLITSYSEDERNSWTSPYILRHRRPPSRSSSMSQHSYGSPQLWHAGTPGGPNSSVASSATPRVLFPAHPTHQDSS